MGGVPLSALLPPEYIEQAEARLRQATDAAGLPLNRPPLVPNTHLAHEAGIFAEEHGKGDAFHQAALRAYFGHARDIGDPRVLAAVGSEVGLDAEALREALDSGRYREVVDEELGRTRELGIQSVPSFVFDGKVGFAGAQSYEVFERAIASLEVKER